MDASTPIGKLIAALKEQLKIKGLHYRHIAARLKVSEGTVKRYFSGKGLDLPVLQKLAETVDLDLLSLVVLAQQQSPDGPELNKAQRALLKRSRFTSFVLFSLGAGMTPAQMGQEFGLTRQQIDAALNRLESAGVIRRLSANVIKILAKPAFGDVGLERDIGVESAREFLTGLDLNAEETVWMLHAVRLSHASAARLRARVQEFIGDLRATSRSEMNLPADETEWFEVFVGAHPIDRAALFRR
jgi:transcriptional regulator with XRE-family HTH domain